eukprot:scaffold3278_cov124-Isochrysis_galbana.AAC.1
MGDARKYPEIRAARFQYAMLWLPKNWIDNNMTYLDSLILSRYLKEDHDYMKLTWPEYHYKHACRLGMCPNTTSSSKTSSASLRLLKRQLFSLSREPREWSTFSAQEAPWQGKDGRHAKDQLRHFFERAIGNPLGPRGQLANPTRYRHLLECSSIVRSEGCTQLLNHPLTKSGLNKEKGWGDNMGRGVRAEGSLGRGVPQSRSLLASSVSI